MSTRKYTTKGRRGRRKQTQKKNNFFKHIKLSNKNTVPRKLLPLSYIATFKGGRKKPEDIIADIQHIAPLLKPVINKVIDLNKSRDIHSPELDIITNNKKLFSKYMEKIADKPDTELINIADFEIMKKLVKAIMEDTSPALWGVVEIVQNMLKKIHLYLINDIEIKDNMRILFKKRMTNNTPYIHIIHKRSGYESIYDANEMLALIQSEVISPKHNTNILKTLDINNHFTTAPPGASSSSPVSSSKSISSTETNPGTSHSYSSNSSVISDLTTSTGK